MNHKEALQNILKWSAHFPEAMNEDLIAATEALQSESEWISVEDRLPTKEDADENGKVLVWREVESTQTLMSKSIYDYMMCKHLDKTSFWMPLPQRPKTPKI